MTTITDSPAPTKPVKRAAAILWSHGGMSQDQSTALATKVLAAALRDDHIAEALWNMDQRAQTPAPRPWREATPEERWPYIETARECSDAILKGQS